MQRRKKYHFKHWVGVLHRWLGLTSGIIVFIVSITGCLYCFHDEIKDVTRPWRKVAVRKQPYVPPSVLKTQAAQKVPGANPSYIVYTGRDRSAAVYSYGKAGEFYVYFDPYTGEYLKTENLRKDFFVIVEYIHLYLLLPAPIGSQVVGVAVFIFIAMLITGLVLWWPRRKTDRKASFTIRWNGRWRRVNYDLHRVLGFYALSIGLILALTGLAIDYEWMHEAFYHTGNLGRSYGDEKKLPVIDTLQVVNAPQPPEDVAFAQTQQLSPKAEMYYVSVPQQKNSPFGSGAYSHALRYDQQDNYYYHPSSGELLKRQPNAVKSPGLKLNEMTYGIHTGQILGLFGKIIAFLASLISASLPVTGFLIWRGRRKKKKPVQPATAMATAHV